MLSQLVHTTLRPRASGRTTSTPSSRSPTAAASSPRYAPFDELHDVGGRFPQLAQFVRSLVHLLRAVAQQAVAAAGGAAAAGGTADASGLRSTLAAARAARLKV